MLRLSTEQRRLIADKAFDLANVGAGALVFGQVLSGGSFSRSQAVLGLGHWLVVATVALFFSREKRR